MTLQRVSSLIGPGSLACAQQAFRGMIELLLYCRGYSLIDVVSSAGWSIGDKKVCDLVEPLISEGKPRVVGPTLKVKLCPQCVGD